MGCLEESKPDPVLDGHLSPIDGNRSASLLKKAGALYPGLGEQRRRPCLRLQQVGVTAFHPASCDADYVSVALSMRPSFEDRPRLAPGTSLCAVWTFLSANLVRDAERSSFLQAAGVYPDETAAARRKPRRAQRAAATYTP